MTITWTPAALVSYEHYTAFLDESLGSNIVNTFRQLLGEKLNLLERYPKAGAIYSRKENIRRLVIHKNTSFYYKVLEAEILILLVWDNRANPQELLRILARE